MWNISVIGTKEDLNKNKSALKFTEFLVRFVDKKDFAKTDFSKDLAVIVFPWDGYKDVFKNAYMEKHLEQHSVIVIGPAIYFFEVENWVIDGLVSFLSYPVNSMQVECVLNEVRRVHDLAEDKSGYEAHALLKNTA